MQTQRKQEGFEGQRMIVLPKKILDYCVRTPPLPELYITDIGYYPQAAHHFRERARGISQHILIYCTNGKGWVKFSGKHYTVKPNEVLIIPAGVPHEYGADESNPWSIYWVHFKGTQTSYFVSQLSLHHTEFVHYTPYVEERIRLFDSIYRTLESGYSLENLSYSNITFSYFLMSFVFPDKFVSAHQEVKKDIVDISIGFMQNNLDKPLTLEEISSFINLSVSHYSNIFRKRTGYPPMVYFNHLKVQHACQFLQFTSLRVNEISLKLGIDDPYYFTRMFTRVMGMSPSQYRSRK